jgi:hypothetical protein
MCPRVVFAVQAKSFPEENFLLWMLKYQIVFDAIKVIVIGCEFLTTIDFIKMSHYKVFVTTYASNKRSVAFYLLAPLGRLLNLWLLIP